MKEMIGLRRKISKLIEGSLSLKMEDKENVASCLLHVDEFFNTIRGLGEKFEE